jgi:putative transposase
VDRKEIILLIAEAFTNGARRIKCCELFEMSLRTLERWELKPEIEDGRKGPNNSPHALSAEEKDQIIALANSEKYRDLSPAKIVPTLADEGKYIASESSFFRVLRSEKMMLHRSSSSPRKISPPEELKATKPNQIWSWDITYLKTAIRGKFYYLYLPMDVFSRMIVHWEIHEFENSDLSSVMIQNACLLNNIQKKQIVLHSDNGGPMKGATMLATLQRIGVIPSLSRPSVSNDNPFSESLFKTLKYCPQYPEKGFESVDNARKLMKKFVHWYNHIHLHSSIRFVTPHARHYGEDVEVLENRKLVYAVAKSKNPKRWSRQIRNWNQDQQVFLNPRKVKEEVQLKMAS